MDARHIQTFTLYLFLYCSVWSLHLRRRANSLSFNFNFSQPGGYNAQDLSFQGDAYLDPQAHTVLLTRNGASSDIHNSVGRVLHAQPVPLWDAVTGKMASFTTVFSFQINANSNNTGDGMAFFLGHYPPTSIPGPLDNGGQNLGLFNKNASTAAAGDDRAVAVELDTYFNAGVDTTSSGHMGIDVNSIVSRAYTDVDVPGKNLTSGIPMTCQIIYGGGKILAALLQIGDVTYRVNASVDLSQVLPSVVAIGFSGATGVAVEINRIMAWSFNSTLDLDLDLDFDPPPVPNSSKIRWKLVEVTAPIIVGVTLLVVCVFVGARRWQLRTRKKRYRALAKGLAHFDYRKLARAANRFAEGNRLGEGGSASVYRGQLTDTGRAVAIKKFKPAVSGQAQGPRDKAFEDELRIASRLRHRNLVELIGWCYDSQRDLVELVCWWWDDSHTRLFLVYELLPQGSLDQHLHGGRSWLPWSKRYGIILGIGSALQYLHVDWEQDQQCIVHGDIKSSNVLLDDDPSHSHNNAKLSDFGLARFVHHETGSRTTDVVQGTYGYVDPAFLGTSQRNRESDVYSFGVVLLEMVSGWDPTARLQNRPPLSSWVKGLHHRDAVLEAADERLVRGESSVGRRQMKRVLLVGLLCVHQDPGSRPSISQAMDALRSEDAQLDVTPLVPVPASTLP